MENHCIIIFGVSGSGKSTVCKLLSELLSLPFLDADEFHSQENIQKMESGTALTDHDRIPWLKAINTSLLEIQNNGFVLACSALKEGYRVILQKNIKKPIWVYLNGSYDQIYHRLKNRKDHFMDPELLQDQFETLEIPEYGIAVSIEYSPREIVNQIIDQISERSKI